MMRFKQIQPGKTAGFTLLEVLVALVVIAVGMLGIAVLYVEGLKAERTSVYRTSAVNMAADLADRIRANPNGGIGYQAAPLDNGCTNGAADCNPAALAQDDLFWIQQDLNNHLPPGATVNVVVTVLPFMTQYDITMTWAEAGFATPQTYSLTMQI
jgi:type IV pilus assembly protein PilV